MKPVILIGAGALIRSHTVIYAGNRVGANFQTGHGAAHDIAGLDVANPIGQVLSAAFLLRESFGLSAAAGAIETGTIGRYRSHRT